MAKEKEQEIFEGYGSVFWIPRAKLQHGHQRVWTRQFEIWFPTWGWFCFAVVPLTWTFLSLFQFLCAYCSPTKPILSNLDKIQLLVDFFFCSETQPR